MTANALVCPVCQRPLAVRLAVGRRSQKAFVMMICAQDGRHIRAFINDRAFVQRVLEQLEDRQQVDDVQRQVLDKVENEGGRE